MSFVDRVRYQTPESPCTPLTRPAPALPHRVATRPADPTSRTRRRPAHRPRRTRRHRQIPPRHPRATATAASAPGPPRRRPAGLPCPRRLFLGRQPLHAPKRRRQHRSQRPSQHPSHLRPALCRSAPGDPQGQLLPGLGAFGAAGQHQGPAQRPESVGFGGGFGPCHHSRRAEAIFCRACGGGVGSGVGDGWRGRGRRRRRGEPYWGRRRRRLWFRWCL